MHLKIKIHDLARYIMFNVSIDEFRHAYIIISSCYNDMAVLEFCIPRHRKLQYSHIWFTLYGSP